MLESTTLYRMQRAFQSQSRMNMYWASFIGIEQPKEQRLDMPPCFAMGSNDVAMLSVNYILNENTDFTKLECRVDSWTYFRHDASHQIRTTANLAAGLLTDQPNIELVYMSILSNMLHVPTQLRDRPN